MSRICIITIRQESQSNIFLLFIGTLTFFVNSNYFYFQNLVQFPREHQKFLVHIPFLLHIFLQLSGYKHIFLVFLYLHKTKPEREKGFCSGQRTHEQ